MTSNYKPSSGPDYFDDGQNGTAVFNNSKSSDRICRSLPPSNDSSRSLMEAILSRSNVDKAGMISKQIMNDACHILVRFVQSPTANVEFDKSMDADNGGNNGFDFQSCDTIDMATSDEDRRLEILCSYASIAAERLCKIASDKETSRKSKKRSWEALQNAAGMLQNIPTTSLAASSESEANDTSVQLEPNALALCLVFGALSFLQQEQQYQHNIENSGAKAAASALSSTISRNDILRQKGRAISSLLLQCYTDHAFRNNENFPSFDLNILSHLAKSFQLTEEDVEPRAVAAIVRNTLKMADNNSLREDFVKQAISGAFSLACQIRPWSILSPVELIGVATAYDFFHSAEEICRSAHKAAKDAEHISLLSLGDRNADVNGGIDRNMYAASKQGENARYAVEMLIGMAIEYRMYRRADTMATSLYHLGGQSRYANARYLHARDTIAKVILKRQLPIVDRQIERVDKAVSKVKNNKSDPLENDLGSEIRKYAIQKLEEVGEIAAAQRLASIYNIDYVYDEEAAIAAASLRREKYLQYIDVLPGDVPRLITNPADLISEFDRLLREEDQELSTSDKKIQKCIGFDAEWDEETQGAALLQLASMKTVLLVDILALSSDQEGVNALRQTVGKLLANPDWTIIGFACRQDLSRLRSSPCVQSQQKGGEQQQLLHWMSTTTGVVDAQLLIGTAEESLRKTGLSRACEHYLGKPLDKAEQCSLWSARPLSESQRSYAALDAWVCVGIYQELLLVDNV
eukprot:CAMPEP_0197192928 /NCGR_PEP_ID=MMETSP1423-20130617/26075_1 /TAXON_ID=476441 /ORGANISM="Pseudo-nitzschia heimii, Strain UNC1101" /LENGTH=747 /DNA_ID=CAMNT_0042645949 /DNA_START=220 /DNA_END=2463 /DNA_ORIENTATION=-